MVSARGAWTKLVEKIASPKKRVARPQRVLDAIDPSVPQRFQVQLDLPPEVLSPNYTPGHWAPKRRATRRYRHSCGVIFLRSRPKGWKACAVELDVIYICPKGSFGYVAHDIQNAIAALKAGVDALADVEIIPTDSNKYLRWGRVDLITTAKDAGDRKPSVIVTVRRA